MRRLGMCLKRVCLLLSLSGISVLYIFDSYSQFEKSMVAYKMELSDEKDDEGEDFTWVLVE